MFYLFFKRNYLWFFFLIALIDFFYAINLYQYIYDGHHHGYMITNAIDFINGRLPYKEIFIQYGIFTTLIHVFALKIFSLNLISINIITCLLYSLTILIISLIIIKKTNLLYGLLSLLIIFFNHPIPWLPWSNYYALFFIVLGFFLLLDLKTKNIFFSGIFFSLVCLSRETYFVVISAIILLIIIYLIFKEKNKLIFIFILGFVIPYSIFFIYLFYNNIFFDWFSYFQLPKLYLSKYNMKIYQAILHGTFYIFFKTWIEILYKPQNIIISLIAVINLIYIFNGFFLKKKKLDFYLLLISIATLIFTVLSISDEIFRLYTSIIIGIIPAINFIFNIKNKENKTILLFLLVFFSIYSLYFFPKGNRTQFEKLNNINFVKNNNLLYFKHQKWAETDWDILNQINKITKTVKKNCKIEYGLNYTFDGFYYLILNLKMLQLAPAITEVENNIFNFFETRFKKDIFSNMQKNNLLLITNGHFKERFNNKNYKTIALYKDKDNIYRDVIYVSFPKKCWD